MLKKAVLMKDQRFGKVNCDESGHHSCASCCHMLHLGNRIKHPYCTVLLKEVSPRMHCREYTRFLKADDEHTAHIR